jgi:hypothetical protein
LPCVFCRVAFLEFFAYCFATVADAHLIKDCCLYGGLRDNAGDHSHQLQLRHPSLRAQLCMSPSCLITNC